MKNTGGCRRFTFRHMRILFTLATVAMLSELTDHQVALVDWMTVVYRRLSSPCVAVCKYVM